MIMPDKYTLALAMGMIMAQPAAFSENMSDTDLERIVGIGQSVYSLPADEADALEFLYKAMPMSDYLMYKPEYHLRNIRIALKARQEMPWGKTVPDNIWRHFVLPARANNEYLDNFRSLYYDELKERVQGLDMKQAALEVNHWLHEKVTYEPSDSRTSAPTATIMTSKGRCGEESVLGVAAFRTIGIPARQVYTPRWAHTDDNHAWVEVWVDGKWHFLGACEPEPDLDRAWFNAPVSRGMLMHTRVFGDYFGSEQQISKSKGITEINVTDNYVPVRDSQVTVTDRNGKPLKGVKVEYKLYNYAEFYTVATRTTDSQGKTTLKTGIGDLLAWASDGTRFGFAKVSGPETRLVLDHTPGDDFSIDIDITPPGENPLPSTVSEADIEANNRRFEDENRLRGLYTETFYGEKNCTLSPADVNLTFGPAAARVENVLKKAKGNWSAIHDFLTSVAPERIDEALGMLDAVSEKDLHDTPARVLRATLDNTKPDTRNPLYIDYVLNPRISNELLTDYRHTMYSPDNVEHNLPVTDIIAIASKIEIDNAANAYRVPVTPYEVWKSDKADAHSRDIFFVAACRNNAIPARIDPVSGACQYHDGDNWVSVDFNRDAKSEVKPQGTLYATFTPSGYLNDPKYYTHFTISKIEQGFPQLFEFGDDIGETYSTLLAKGVSLPEGYYMLTTGVRQASGKVSAHVSMFNVTANQTSTEPLIMRHSPDAIEVIGNIDPEQKFLPKGKDGSQADAEQSILSVTGRGYFILGILGDTDEPSNHCAGELEALNSQLLAWCRPIVLIGKQRDNLQGNPLITWGSDPDNKVCDMLEAVLPPHQGIDTRLPLIVVADSFGRVVFISTGYDTSLAQKLTQILPQL